MWNSKDSIFQFKKWYNCRIEGVMYMEQQLVKMMEQLNNQFEKINNRFDAMDKSVSRKLTIDLTQ